MLMFLDLISHLNRVASATLHSESCPSPGGHGGISGHQRDSHAQSRCRWRSPHTRVLIMRVSSPVAFWLQALEERIFCCEVFHFSHLTDGEEEAWKSRASNEPDCQRCG